MGCRTSSLHRILIALVISGAMLAPAIVVAQSLEFTITGTKLESNQFGLPSYLEGIVFYRGGPDHGKIAGMYRETVKPTIDPELGFVGTTGTSIFSFVKRVGGAVVTAELTTQNHSSIVGEVPARGAILVESTGKVIEGTGRFKGVRGSMVSSSTVILGTVFNLDVKVTFSLEGYAASVGAVAGGEDLASSPSMIIQLQENGEAAVRYTRGFKVSLLRRMLDETSSITPAQLEGVTGISRALLTRWLGEARALTALTKQMKKLFPGPVQRSFEEKLRIVLDARKLPEDRLSDFLEKNKIDMKTIAEWEAAIVKATYSTSEDAGPKKAVAKENGASPAEKKVDAAALEALKRLGSSVEALLKNQGKKP